MAMHPSPLPQTIESTPLPAGCYAFTGERASRGYRLNRFCHALLDPGARERFKADPGQAMTAAALAADEIAMVNARDWLGLVRHGVSPFLLFRLSGAMGEGLAATGARMRGQTLEAFMRTRQVTGAR
jgi:protocatechuate 4,5-dioxygenase alpha subunit